MTEIKLKKSLHAPTTFHQRLVAAEQARHARRLAEIKKAEAKLRMFEPTAAALEAKGIQVSLEFPLGTGKELPLSKGGLTSWDHSLYDALIALGYIESARDIRGIFAFVTLKKARLQITMSVHDDHPTQVVQA